MYFVLLFARESARRANNYDQTCCSEVHFVWFFARNVLAWPTHMTQYVAPTCTLYCFFARGSARRANKYDQTCCSEVHFALFFARESVRVAHTYDPRCCPEVYFVLFFARDGGEGGALIGPGWPPVAWGRGCLLIGNSDKPLPEGEEGVVEEGRGIALDHLSP